MKFTGKIQQVRLSERDGDIVALKGHMFDRGFEIDLKGAGIGELMVGRYGLNKETVTVKVGNGEDL